MTGPGPDRPTRPEVLQRLLCIAQMAATLEAGDRSRNLVDNVRIGTPRKYAERAAELFIAVVDTLDALPAPPITGDKAS